MKHDENYENDAFEDDDVELNDEEYRSSGGTLRWLSIAFVGAAITGFIMLAWYAYKSGMEPVSEDEIPYVSADTDPFKEKPEDPGGLQFEHQDKSVYNQLASGNGTQNQMAERLLPPPEEPVERTVSEPVNPEEFQKEPVETIAEAPKATERVESVPLASVPKEQVETVEVAPVAAVETPVAVEPAKPVEEVVVEKPAPQPEPEVEAEAEETPAPAVKTGKFMAQLGAFSSEEEAHTAWAKISAAHGSAFPTKNHVLQRADVSGKTFHRLQVGPFESETSARKICDYLQEHKQACFIVSMK